MKKKWIFLLALIFGLVVFNIFWGDKLASLYIWDTIYATTYLGLTIIFVGAVLLISLLIFFIKILRNYTRHSKQQH